MPDVLPLVFGPQGGFHIEARARVRGVVPGDPGDVQNPRNPRTRFRAFFLDGPLSGMPINPAQCPNRLGYVPAADGDGFTTPVALEIWFDTAANTVDLFDKQFKVVVEVIDANNHYAMTEQVITAIAPEGWTGL